MIPTTTQDRQRKVANAGIAAVVGGLLLSLFGATLASATAGPPAKVTICHATASTSNPYQELSVNESSLDGGGTNDHAAHTGPVFDFSDPAGNQAWGDIVPSFGTFGGLNWTAEGQDVYGHGCGDPAPPPVDPEPCTHDPQLTADDPACLPPVDPEPCTYDPQLTADDPTCLAQVEDELLTPPVDSTPTEPGSSPDSGSVLSVSSSGEAGTPAVTTLPRTGRSVGPMATTGVSLVLLGVGILFMQRRTLLAHHRSSQARHMARSADRR